jgi:hypothetical protein
MARGLGTDERFRPREGRRPDRNPPNDGEPDQKLTNARIRLYAIDAVRGAWDDAMFHVRALKLSRPERCPEPGHCRGTM